MFHDKSPVPEDFLREMAMINCSSREYRSAVGKVTREGIWREYIDSVIHSVKVPVLVASARYDRVVPPELGEMYHDLLPNSKLVIWEKAGHMLPWEQADDLSREIAAFCR